MIPRAAAKWGPIVWRTMLIAAAVLLVYMGGYAATFWLSGRGCISVEQALRIESTVYLPLQLYRFSNLPGHQLASDFRQSCFDAGQSSLK